MQKIKDNKYTILLLLIIFIGALFRFYKIDQNFFFDGEVGQNYLEVRDYISLKSLPLLGPATSHPWLFFGPLFYWLLVPILLLSGYSPLAPTLVIGYISILAILANYIFVEKYFDRRTAIISSFLIALSPIWIMFSKWGRFFSINTFLIYPFLISLFGSLKETKKSFFLPGLLLGIMLNFHYSVLVLVPGAILLGLIHHKSLRQMLFGLIGLSIPLVSVIVARPEMFVKLIGWSFYRLAGFMGVITKNNILFTQNLHGFLPILFACLVLYILVLLKKIDWSWSANIVLILLFTSFLPVFVHGNPPIHYLLPLVPLIYILLGNGLSNLLASRYGKVVVAILIMFLFLFESKYSSLPKTVPFKLQAEIVKTIIYDSQGNNFSIDRIGPGDNFAQSLSFNYKYLLWLYGKEPSTDADTKYVIDETGSGKGEGGVPTKLIWISGVDIARYDQVR